MCFPGEAEPLPGKMLKARCTYMFSVIIVVVINVIIIIILMVIVIKVKGLMHLDGIIIIIVVVVEDLIYRIPSKDQ